MRKKNQLEPVGARKGAGFLKPPFESRRSPKRKKAFPNLKGLLPRPYIHNGAPSRFSERKSQ